MAAGYSPLEIGLLTVAERRGFVWTARKVDARNDPAGVERLILLHRLADRGLLAELPQEDPEGADIHFALTDQGRAVLADVDGEPPPAPSNP